MVWLGLERLKVASREFPPLVVDHHGVAVPWISDRVITSKYVRKVIISN